MMKLDLLEAKVQEQANEIKGRKGKVTLQKMELHNANARIEFFMQEQLRNEDNTRQILLNVTSAMGNFDQRILQLESKVTI